MAVTCNHRMLQQERIRLLELLVSSQCPQQAAALASPHLESVISYLRTCFQVKPTWTLPNGCLVCTLQSQVARSKGVDVC
jgi:hypothetical protein